MQQSWLELVRNQFKDYPPWAVELGTFGIVFLLLGFIVKSFGKSLALSLLILLIVIAGLHYVNLVPIDIIRVKEFLGLQDATLLQDVPTIFAAWAREHVLACVSAVVGFMVGYQLG